MLVYPNGFVRTEVKTKLKTLEAKARYRAKVMTKDKTIVKMTYSAIDGVFFVYRRCDGL